MYLPHHDDKKPDMNTRNMKDYELLDEIRRGNIQAFKEILNRYLPLVSRTSYRIMCDRTDSETVTKSVFLSLWRDPDSFKGRVYDELLTRTCRICRIQLLKRNLFTILSLNPDVFVFSAPSVPSADEYIARKAWEVFCRASGNCSGTQRVIYTLCELECLPHDTAASVGRILPSHVRPALEQARENVRIELDHYGRMDDYDSYVGFLRKVEDQLTDVVRLQKSILDAIKH